MKSFRIALCIIPILTSSCFAYDFKKCARSNPVGEVLGLNLLVSSTMMTTSIDGCAIWADSSNRNSFISSNLQTLKIEFARGQGEYADAIALLYGCTTRETNQRFKKSVKNHFETIFYPNDKRSEDIDVHFYSIAAEDCMES